MRELSDEETSIHDSKDEDFKEQDVMIDDHTSDSELSMDEDGDQNSIINSGFRFFIRKDQETLWIDNTVAIPGEQTKSKNIVKKLHGPMSIARNTPIKLDSFVLFTTPQMIDDVVLYTNKYISKKRSEVNYSRTQDLKDTSNYSNSNHGTAWCSLSHLYKKEKKTGHTGVMGHPFH